MRQVLCVGLSVLLHGLGVAGVVICGLDTEVPDAYVMSTIPVSHRQIGPPYLHAGALLMGASVLVGLA